MRPLFLTNTLTREKELFKPINEGRVGMYVCGPTVYGDAHLASSSVDDNLLRNFLRECKNILKFSRLRAGCFDTLFYGFQEIRT